MLKMYTCWYQSGNFIPQVQWLPRRFPRWLLEFVEGILGRVLGVVLVWLLGGVLGTFLGLGKANLKKD